jgi:hypothetical protein
VGPEPTSNWNSSRGQRQRLYPVTIVRDDKLKRPSWADGGW